LWVIADFGFGAFIFGMDQAQRTTLSNAAAARASSQRTNMPKLG